MAVTGIVGAQWGDEGKGKIIDILAERSDVVVRSQGGNNAGHTVVFSNESFKLHLIPSGIFYPDKINLICSGTVIDPKSLSDEMDGLIKRGISLKNLKIDPRAHVVFPYHILLDALNEASKGKEAIGTTKRGIGPCYADKADRIGLRLCDLLTANFKERLAAVLEHKNKILNFVYGLEKIQLEPLFNEYKAYAKRLEPFIADCSSLVYDAVKAGKEVLFEGAQGALLDLDMGTYPFVTSSHPTSGGFCVGAGVGPTVFDKVIGVSKSYTTRVGEGPFPTELDASESKTAEYIRQNGMEFGTTTGRARRIGWLDLVILKSAVRLNGLTEFVVNKMDTLSGLNALKVCTEYSLDGKIIQYIPWDLDALARCKPIYTTLKGWHSELSGIRSYSDLPTSAKDYIDFIQNKTECKITMVGVGSDRAQNLIV